MAMMPAALWEKVSAFLTAKKTGQLVLDIKDGRILAYKLTEAGRVQYDDEAQKRQTIAHTNGNGVD